MTHSGKAVRNVLAAIAAALLLALPALAQTDAESVLYTFTGGSDGAIPADMVFDSAGNLYGTTFQGGNTSTSCDAALGVNGCGVVFKLTPATGGGWTETVLYTFSGGSDGAVPSAGVVLDSAGNLYGTTLGGGDAASTNCTLFEGCGVVFKLTPTASGPWKETVLYTFTGGSDGGFPFAGVLLDTAGNLYGEALVGGNTDVSCTNGGSGPSLAGCGVVFKLTSSVSSPWKESVLYTFSGESDGGGPYHGLKFDSAGNLYGVTPFGGDTAVTCYGETGCGVVFKLEPASSGPWKETVLYAFTGGPDGGFPASSLTFDASGNVYGTAAVGGNESSANCVISSPFPPGCGLIFELTPATSGPWTETILYTFTGATDGAIGFHENDNRSNSLLFDSSGNLYGSTPFGGDLSENCSGFLGCGVVFRLAPNASGPWTESLLYTFTGGADGGVPAGGLLFDAGGNIYSHAYAGGNTSDCTGNFFAPGCGLILKLTPITATTTVVTSSLNPSVSGQAVTFTATVSGGGSPTGTVSFTANSTPISGCSSVTLSSNQAQCTTSTLPVGSDTIVATYSGNGSNKGSSGGLTQVVNSSGKTATTTTVTSSLNPSLSGQAVTFTATVAPAGSPTPTGTVSFTSNEAAITGCTAITLSSSRTAVCTTSALAAGTDVIVATYSGDSHYGGSLGSFSELVNPVATAVQFIPMIPCRVLDTRYPSGPFGGPAIPGGTSRNFAIPAGACVIPATAVAYSLNVTVVPSGPLGYLTIWPAGEGQPVVSTLNSLDGRIKANAAIVPAGVDGAVSVYVSNTTEVVLDVNGYFEASSSATLEYYPLTPCRVADTRKATGPLGGPSLVADEERDFPVLSSSCSIPSSARAYSLNFTAIPPSGEALGYLTVWPEGEARPLVSTLNDLTGTVVANAALVPAGTDGEIAVYASNGTNLAIDINGYFAAAGTGGLQLYPVTPCRVEDTRSGSGAFSNTTLAVNVVDSACAPPGTAQGYVFNATVIPTGSLGYLTLWPDGEGQPVVSTLNALDGAITSNMAIVPNSDGKTDAYASGTTQLVLDISAYFAP